MGMHNSSQKKGTVTLSVIAAVLLVALGILLF